MGRRSLVAYAIGGGIGAAAFYMALVHLIATLPLDVILVLGTLFMSITSASYLGMALAAQAGLVTTSGTLAAQLIAAAAVFAVASYLFWFTAVKPRKVTKVVS